MRRSMKRSQAISAIANYRDFVGGKLGAEDLLSKLERMGMKPPGYLENPESVYVEGEWQPEESTKNEDPDDDRYCGAI